LHCNKRHTIDSYFVFSHTKVFWLIFPSPEKRAGREVYINRSPSFVISRTNVVPVNTSFQEYIDVVFNPLAIELVRAPVRRHRTVQLSPLLVCDLVNALGLRSVTPDDEDEHAPILAVDSFPKYPGLRQSPKLFVCL
jgi:hypothetical protein